MKSDSPGHQPKGRGKGRQKVPKTPASCSRGAQGSCCGPGPFACTNHSQCVTHAGAQRVAATQACARQLEAPAEGPKQLRTPQKVAYQPRKAITASIKTRRGKRGKRKQINKQQDGAFQPNHISGAQNAGAAELGRRTRGPRQTGTWLRSEPEAGPPGCVCRKRERGGR